MTDASQKLYERGKEEERIRPTVTKKVEEENPGTETKPDSTLLLAQDNFKEAKTILLSPRL